MSNRDILILLTWYTHWAPHARARAPLLLRSSGTLARAQFCAPTFRVRLLHMALEQLRERLQVDETFAVVLSTEDAVKTAGSMRGLLVGCLHS